MKELACLLSKFRVQSSEEVVLAKNGRKVVFSFSLCWCCKCLESGKCLRVMYTLLKEVKFRLAHPHLPFHFKHALASIVKWIETDWLELEVLRVATKEIESFGLGLLGMSLVHGWCCSFLFVVNDLATALVEVNVEEYHLLNRKGSGKKDGFERERTSIFGMS